MRRPLARTLLLAAACFLCVSLLGAADARAKLDSKAWKEAEALCNELFAQRGNPEGKAKVLETILSDGTGRAWRMISGALLQEVKLWTEINREYVDAANEHGSILQQAGIDGYTAEEERRAKTLQDQLKKLELQARVERETLTMVVGAIATAPEAVRAVILQRAKSGGDWPYRAVAVRVAAATMSEKKSRSFFLKSLASDKDPRVRLVALDALATAESDWEGLVLGRIADPDWGVVLRAVRILQERESKRAVPHLINALSRATPRVGESIGEALRSLTGANFEPYADVWEKWWKDHKGDFEASVPVKKGKQKEFASLHFYGVPIKSDRVLFIIDVSASMKLETKNQNPKDLWKPPPTVTGGDRPPPPPPPPEAILSGPKIKVAQHELKKTIQKMPAHWTFNIIAFNTGLKAWRDTMVKADKKTKAAALKWVRNLKPSGSTYVDGALKKAFSIAGLINFDNKYPDIAVDTIVLLSDGAPTDNSFPHAKLMKPEEILEHVRQWNKDKKVVIHCIGVDMIDNVEFLTKLAAENGGVFTNR